MGEPPPLNPEPLVVDQLPEIALAEGASNVDAKGDDQGGASTPEVGPEAQHDGPGEGAAAPNVGEGNQTEDISQLKEKLLGLGEQLGVRDAVVGYIADNEASGDPEKRVEWFKTQIASAEAALKR